MTSSLKHCIICFCSFCMELLSLDFILTIHLQQFSLFWFSLHEVGLSITVEVLFSDSQCSNNVLWSLHSIHISCLTQVLWDLSLPSSELIVSKKSGFWGKSRMHCSMFMMRGRSPIKRKSVHSERLNMLALKREFQLVNLGC